MGKKKDFLRIFKEMFLSVYSFFSGIIKLEDESERISILLEISRSHPKLGGFLGRQACISLDMLKKINFALKEHKFPKEKYDVKSGAGCFLHFGRNKKGEIIILANNYTSSFHEPFSSQVLTIGNKKVSSVKIRLMEVAEVFQKKMKLVAC